MLYRIIRPLARIALRASFRKIYFTNEDLIPWDKPVILAVNHPTSFIEPCLLATHLPKPLYFLARGDLFKKPFYAKMLDGVHILPIFRMKDGGYSKIKNNFSTFEKSFDAIRDHKTILIMAEGRCIQEKRLRPLRKGTARLAFGAIEKHGDLDIQIVPVGVNYTYPSKFRSEVLLDFGQPIAVRDYLEQYDQHPQEAIKELTAELEVRLRKRIVIIDDIKDEHFTEIILQQYRNDHPDRIFPIVSPKEVRLQAEVSIANKVNNMPPDKKADLKNMARDYIRQLQKIELDDWGIANNTFSKWQNFIILILGFVPFLLGFIGNYLPIWYAKFTMDVRVKDVEDKMSVGIAVGIGATLLYYILLLTFCFISGNNKWALFVILLPVWGYFALLYMDYYKRWMASYRFQKLPNAIKTELAAKRRAIALAFYGTKKDNQFSKN